MPVACLKKYLIGYHGALHRPSSPKTMICCDLADPLIIPFIATTRSWFQLKTEMVGWT